MKYSLLQGINSPGDVKKLEWWKLDALCAEIRDFLIQSVSQTGGHLSSNLGVIELTVALHRCLSTPQDQILFDVGHQSYTHKLLTGRREGFEKLRMSEGLSGFPSPDESEHDAFRAGHGSAALSAAVGIARAKKMNNQPGMVAVVVGDGAFTGGMTYEAINNIGGLNNLIIILNDNTMSISKNVGALAHYLTRLRTNPKYYTAKDDIRNMLDKTPLIGDEMVKGIQSIKSAVRKSLYHSTFFEEMGLRYTGPVDGHDLEQLCGILRRSRQATRPLLLHIETQKGKGFTPAEKNPGAFHGVSSFDANKISDPDLAPSDSFSTVFGQSLAKLADDDTAICAITAAMKYGTGLQYMKKHHLDRFFDVGMAEEHAVTFAAGLAAAGMRPVVAIYSTFLQRAYDQIIHDVMLGGYDVLFAIDRAGLVPGDGETHQGIFDTAFLSQHATLPVFAPCNYAELSHWLGKLMQQYTTPRAIRYARGVEPPALAQKECTGNLYDCVRRGKRAKIALVGYGTLLEEVLAAAELLEKEGIPADVYQLVQINPLPQGFAEELQRYKGVLFAEDGIKRGGIGEHVAIALLQNGYKGGYVHCAIEDIHIDHANVSALRRQVGLDAAALAQKAKETLV